MKAFNKFTENYAKDRDKAVTECIENDTLDPFKAFHKKYTELGLFNLDCPHDEILKISVRKMACNSRGVSVSVMEKAKRWLDERGLSCDL